MRENPRFAGELWTMVDRKYADRLYRVSHAVVATAGEKHGGEIGRVLTEVVRHRDRAHPRLAYDVALEAVAVRQDLARPAPGWGTELASDLEARSGAVLPDVLASIDRHDPTLRSDLRAGGIKAFPDLREQVAGFVKARWPDFMPRALAL